MQKILFECLDKNVPAGGVRRLYRHVEILRKAGFDAYMLHHTPGFKMTWFHSDAAVLYWDASFEFGPTDVLVIPEGHGSVMKATMHCAFRRVVISLNWASIYAGLPLGLDWRDFNITTVLAGGYFERDFIRATMGIESHVLRQGLDTNLFHPGEIKIPRVTYMSRKQPQYARLIEGIFRSIYPQFRPVPFIAIQDLTHEEVAKALADSSVFLAHSFPEGVSRKMLEAMACGCIVVGHAGHGSLEFMRHLENCYLAPDGDALTAARYIGIALQALERGDAAAMQLQARSTSLNYAPDLEEQSVLDFWRAFLCKDQASMRCDPWVYKTM